jgi:GTPase SAR1 family protein
VKGSNGKIGMWDLGGSQNAREFWSSFYQNVHITGIIFVFDVKNTDRLREGII